MKKKFIISCISVSWQSWFFNRSSSLKKVVESVNLKLIFFRFNCFAVDKLHRKTMDPSEKERKRASVINAHSRERTAQQTILMKKVITEYVDEHFECEIQQIHNPSAKKFLVVTKNGYHWNRNTETC